MSDGQPLSDDYFRSGIFAGALPGEVFQKYTCSTCGMRLKTWDAFKAHRQKAECRVPGERPRWLTEQQAA